MKKILICIVLLSCIVSACKKINQVSFSGVFKLEKQTISGNGEDTMWIRKQMKIYTDRHYIYAGMALDSSVRFSVGSYNLDTGNRIVEHNMFSNKVLDSTQIFTVMINKTTKGFTGVIPDWARSKQNNYKLTEEYTSLPLKDVSELDGLWVLGKMYRVNGKDTTLQHETQFKLFWRGYFVFVHQYPIDPLGTQLKNGFGYGTFSLDAGSINENIEVSSHSALTGHNLSIKITFKGTDEYTQIENDPKTGERTTAVYRRIK